MKIEIGKAVKLLLDDVGFIAYDDVNNPVLVSLDRGDIAVVIGITINGQYVLQADDDEYMEIFSVVGVHVIEELNHEQ